MFLFLLCKKCISLAFLLTIFVLFLHISTSRFSFPSPSFFKFVGFRYFDILFTLQTSYFFHYTLHFLSYFPSSVSSHLFLSVLISSHILLFSPYHLLPQFLTRSYYNILIILLFSLSFLYIFPSLSVFLSSKISPILDFPFLLSSHIFLPLYPILLF